jgi:hypothetical protein
MKADIAVLEEDAASIFRVQIRRFRNSLGYRKIRGEWS